ncbi:unnamed protein product [Fusarium venenatum]|uniref:Uncharacterized protein n=1 Tax=Fusarium venenatum TaxID=56646 RepID=A0A2L2T5S5_9HYPO|nr:uncharacterized protein FVRRES_07519 [Fusarium venenatum]CEI63083.1 unnamed protein product [Fusarium venenatum]
MSLYSAGLPTLSALVQEMENQHSTATPSVQARNAKMGVRTRAPVGTFTPERFGKTEPDGRYRTEQ